jgi:hypothetical protein
MLATRSFRRFAMISIFAALSFHDAHAQSGIRKAPAPDAQAPSSQPAPADPAPAVPAPAPRPRVHPARRRPRSSKASPATPPKVAN